MRKKLIYLLCYIMGAIGGYTIGTEMTKDGCAEIFTTQKNKPFVPENPTIKSNKTIMM